MAKSFLMMSALLFVINSCGGKADNLSVGDKAPEFSLEDHNGNIHSLNEYTNAGPVVIYFYPKANTSGCTKQACGIRDDYSKFSENGIAIFGISVDSKEDIASFVQEHGLNFPLLSDFSKKVSAEYGVLNKIGLASRITFVIDKNGNIANILREIDIENHSEQILDLSKKLI